MTLATQRHRNETSSLPKQLWGTAPRSATGGTGPYLTNQGCEETLRAACRALGISGYRMAALLGIRHVNYMKWFSGSSRPSSKYFARITMLFVFRTNGLTIVLVDRIDWVNEWVIYKKGVKLGDAQGKSDLHQFCGGMA
jgi:hypothetical protein